MANNIQTYVYWLKKDCEAIEYEINRLRIFLDKLEGDDKTLLIVIINSLQNILLNVKP